VTRLGAYALIFAGFFVSTTASALDKQGSAHGGGVAGDDHDHDNEMNFSGAVTLGSSIINKSYAARPDNTGLALMRYAAHGDIDLIGRKLSIPIDLNSFTDRKRKGALVFAPTEFDVIGGVTTTNSIAKPIDLELGARVEHDRPVDKGHFTQTYADVRARMLYSLAKQWPGLKNALIDGDISGYATLGWFAINPSYAARPDNSGLALFRYVAHSELSIYKDYFSIGLDGTFFTDRRKNAVSPSELDVTYEIIGRAAPFEVHVAYERDMPLDKDSLVQSFLYVLLVYGFDFQHKTPPPLEERGHIQSP
jgi:hypothetical protein